MDHVRFPMHIVANSSYILQSINSERFHQIAGDLQDHSKSLIVGHIWFPISLLHRVSKKFPPLNWRQLCQILTDFQIFNTTEKHMKCATKLIGHYTHLTLGMLLTWEIKNSNFLQIFSR